MPVQYGQGDVFRAAALQKWLGVVDVVNVWHFQKTGIGLVDADDMYDAIADYLDTFYTLFVSWIVTSLTYESIDVYAVPSSYHLGDLPWPTLTAGASENDPLASGVAFLIRLFSEAVRGQGRKFIAGFDETVLNDGVFEGVSFLTAMLSAGVMAATEFEASNGITLRAGIYRESDTTFYPFLGALYNTIPSYQRRRRQGVGS